MSGPRAFHWLPGVLCELVESAGLDAVLRFADALGGTRLKVPKRIPDHHRLVELLGRRGADALTSLYGGEEIDVPLGRQGQQRRRCDEALARGLSADRAARASGLTWRTAYRRKRKLKARADDPQGRLF